MGYVLVGAAGHAFPSLLHLLYILSQLCICISVGSIWAVSKSRSLLVYVYSRICKDFWTRNRRCHQYIRIHIYVSREIERILYVASCTRWPTGVSDSMYILGSIWPYWFGQAHLGVWNPPHVQILTTVWRKTHAQLCRRTQANTFTSTRTRLD